MAKFNNIVHNFINGEVSPKLRGRIDSDSYRRSCKTVKNMQVLPQGGVQRRVGTQFIPTHFDERLALTSGARLIPFTVSLDEQYLLNFSRLKYNEISVYNVQQDYWFQIAINSAYINANISEPEFASGLDTYTTIVDPLLDADVLAEMQYSQNGNIILITHKTFPPILIQRFDVNDFAGGFWNHKRNTFSLSYASNTPDYLENSYPYEMNQNLNHTMDVALGTASASTTLNSSLDHFTAGHIGSFFVLQDGSTLAYCHVTAVADSKNATVYITKTASAAGGFVTGTKDNTVAWGWGEASWSKHNGWPGSVAFSGGRAVFAGNYRYPEFVWTSEVNDVFRFSVIGSISPGTALVANDPGTLIISSFQMNEISWISDSNRNLLVGTRGREYYIPDLDTTNQVAISSTSHGSEYVQPLSIDGNPVFVQRGFRKLRDLSYSDKADGYAARDITFFAEHISKLSTESGTNLSKIKQMAYQELDNKILWVIDNNGALFYCTLDKENNVVAFATAELGGTDVVVHSIASLPSKNTTTDELYLLVSRTIDSSTKTYLEKLGPDFVRDTLNVSSELRENLPVYMDCAKVFRLHAEAQVSVPLKADASYILDATTSTGTETGTIVYGETGALFDAASYITFPAGVASGTAHTLGNIKFDLYFDNGAGETVFDLVDTGVANKNRMIFDTFVVGTTNSYRFRAFDSSNNLQITLTTPVVPNGASVEPFKDSIEISYDYTAGATYLFVNGVLKASDTTTTFATTATHNSLILGRDSVAAGNYLGAKSSIRDFSWFGVAGHTSAYEVYQYQANVLYDSSVATVIKQLEYLEGQSVQVVGDGNYLGDYTVSGGSITLTNTPPTNGWDTLIVGLKYAHTLEPNALEAGSAIGSSQGAIKRIDRLIARFRSTAACDFGATISNVAPITFRDADALMGDPIGLFTGDKVLELDGDYDRNATVVLSGDSPLPCNITCLILRGNTHE